MFTVTNQICFSRSGNNPDEQMISSLYVCFFFVYLEKNPFFDCMNSPRFHSKHGASQFVCYVLEHETIKLYKPCPFEWVAVCAYVFRTSLFFERCTGTHRIEAQHTNTHYFTQNVTTAYKAAAATLKLPSMLIPMLHYIACTAFASPRLYTHMRHT